MSRRRSAAAPLSHHLDWDTCESTNQIILLETHSTQKRFPVNHRTFAFDIQEIELFALVVQYWKILSHFILKWIWIVIFSFYVQIKSYS